MKCVFLIALVLAAGCVSTTPEPALTTTASMQKVVEITDSGFVPLAVGINKGESVIWINNMTVPSWPASDAHPTHLLYPEKGGCIDSKFDACKGIAAGENFTFAFYYNGTWAYHDHLRSLDPKFKGTVTVR